MLDIMKPQSKVEKTGGKRYQLANAGKDATKSSDKTNQDSKKKKNKKNLRKKLRTLK